MCAEVDGEVKCCCAVATCRVDCGICWSVSARIIGVVVPTETIAGGDSLNDAVTMVDSQVQGVAAWASVIVCIVEGIVV